MKGKRETEKCLENNNSKLMVSGQEDGKNTTFWATNWEWGQTKGPR